MWFGNEGGGSIGRITTTGQVTTYGSISFPNSITVGPDKALWAISFAAKILRVTTTGQVTSFTGAGDNTYGIAAGPDGALWFCNAVTPGSIGRMTTVGQVTTYHHPGISSPVSIVAGPDGAMWFNSENGYIGRIIAR
jgi:virginiamycin B lyase